MHFYQIHSRERSYGKLAARAVPTEVLTVLLKNFLRLMVAFLFLFHWYMVEAMVVQYYFFNVMERAFFLCFQCQFGGQKNNVPESWLFPFC